MSKNYLNERERTARKVNFQLLYHTWQTNLGNPIIRAEPIPKHIKRLIGFNEVMTCKNPIATGVHFFIDDYQFERLWEKPEKYLDRLSQFPLVLQPDWSLYSEYPRPVQVWNHYRNQMIGAWMQSQGINVVATPSWSDDDSLKWAFDGIEEGAPVAISTVGVGHQADIRGFMRGIAVLQEQKRPTEMIVYGKMLDPLRSHVLRYNIRVQHFLNGQAMRIDRYRKRQDATK